MEGYERKQMEESGRNSVPLRAAGGADGLREEGAALADGMDILQRRAAWRVQRGRGGV